MLFSECIIFIINSENSARRWGLDDLKKCRFSEFRTLLRNKPLANSLMLYVISLCICRCLFLSEIQVSLVNSGKYKGIWHITWGYWLKVKYTTEQQAQCIECDICNPQFCVCEEGDSEICIFCEREFIYLQSDHHTQYVELVVQNSHRTFLDWLKFGWRSLKGEGSGGRCNRSVRAHSARFDQIWRSA